MGDEQSKRRLGSGEGEGDIVVCPRIPSANTPMRNKKLQFVFGFVFVYFGILIGGFLFKRYGNGSALVADLLSHLVMPVLVFFGLFYRDKKNFAMALDEFKCTFSSVVVSAALGLCFALVFLYASQVSIPSIGVVGANAPQSLLALVTTQYGVAGVLYLAASAAVVEELLFKTILIRAIDQNLTQNRFAVLSALLFVLLHATQGPIAIFVIAIYGYLTAVYYFQERRILNLIVLHGVADTLVFLYWGSISRI